MSSVTLQQGATYRGRAVVAYIKQIVTHDAVINELAKFGITPAQVWFHASELPADWPASAREDVSSWNTTQIFLEGTWTKPTGQYQTSGSKWGIYDYWMYKAAPQVEPPAPPPCKKIGDVCAVHGDCCSQNCANGVCAEQQGAPPPPANVTCGWYGVDCSNLNCCEGLTCQQDTAGDLGGGMRCITAPAQTDVPPGPGEPITLGLGQTPKPSDWWYAAGAAAVVGIGWLVLNKMYLRVPATNPAERKAYRVIFDKPAPLNLVNKLIANAREKKLQIDMPRLDVSVDLIFVKAKDGAGPDLVRRRFAEAWRETLVADFEERWGKEWYLRGGRDEYAPEFMKY